jgi:hypothetical protein
LTYSFGLGTFVRCDGSLAITTKEIVMVARTQAGYQIISTRMHGVEDYALVLLLLAAPYLFGFANGTAAQYVPQIIGIMILGVSLNTRYELGVMGIIPMPLHLMMDAGAAIILAASPWLFGFSKFVYLPHLMLGLGEVLVVAMSETQPRKVPGSPARA